MHCSQRIPSHTNKRARAGEVEKRRSASVGSDDAAGTGVWHNEGRSGRHLEECRNLSPGKGGARGGPHSSRRPKAGHDARARRHRTRRRWRCHGRWHDDGGISVMSLALGGGGGGGNSSRSGSLRNGGAAAANDVVPGVAATTRRVGNDRATRGVMPCSGRRHGAIRSWRVRIAAAHHVGGRRARHGLGGSGMQRGRTAAAGAGLLRVSGASAFGPRLRRSPNECGGRGDLLARSPPGSATATAAALPRRKPWLANTRGSHEEGTAAAAVKTRLGRQHAALR